MRRPTRLGRLLAGGHQGVRCLLGFEGAKTGSERVRAGRRPRGCIRLIATQAGAFEQLVDDPKRLVGYAAVRPLLAGDPLLLNDWRPVAVVRAGDRVKVAVTGTGFELSSDGQAIESGKVGDRVRVRLDDGRIVTGVATSLGAVAVQLE